MFLCSSPDWSQKSCVSGEASCFWRKCCWQSKAWWQTDTDWQHNRPLSWNRCPRFTYAWSACRRGEGKSWPQAPWSASTAWLSARLSSWSLCAQWSWTRKSNWIRRCIGTRTHGDCCPRSHRSRPSWWWSRWSTTRWCKCWSKYRPLHQPIHLRSCPRRSRRKHRSEKKGVLGKPIWSAACSSESCVPSSSRTCPGSRRWHTRVFKTAHSCAAVWTSSARKPSSPCSRWRGKERSRAGRKGASPSCTSCQCDTCLRRISRLQTSTPTSHWTTVCHRRESRWGRWSRCRRTWPSQKMTQPSKTFQATPTWMRAPSLSQTTV